MQKLVDHQQINWSNFEMLLRKQIDNIPNADLEVKKFKEGFSNQTYLITFGDWEGVMRCPPFGEIPPKAHDMKREYKLLEKISRAYSLAPKPFLYSEDKSIMSRHFYVMEKKHGVVIDDTLPEKFDDSKKNGPIISRSVVEALVKLHAIDCKKENLMEIGKPEGYLERQVHSWMKRYKHSKTDNVTNHNHVEKWLIDQMPKTEEITIVHNDFKLNNLVFDANDISVLNGVLDWELATIGDPLTDVGSSVVLWREPTDPDIGVNIVTNQPGFYRRRDFIEAYASISGRDISNITFYVTFGFYKLAVILQQIYYRWSKGELQDERFQELYKAVNNLMEMAELTKNNRIL